MTKKMLISQRNTPYLLNKLLSQLVFFFGCVAVKLVAAPLFLLRNTKEWSYLQSFYCTHLVERSELIWQKLHVFLLQTERETRYRFKNNISQWCAEDGAWKGGHRAVRESRVPLTPGQMCRFHSSFTSLSDWAHGTALALWDLCGLAVTYILTHHVLTNHRPHFTQTDSTRLWVPYLIVGVEFAIRCTGIFMTKNSSWLQYHFLCQLYII